MELTIKLKTGKEAVLTLDELKELEEMLKPETIKPPLEVIKQTDNDIKTGGYSTWGSAKNPGYITTATANLYDKNMWVLFDPHYYPHTPNTTL